MNDNAKVFSLIEMREMMIDTSDYQMMEEVGEFTGTLEMKAQGHKKSIRIFLTLGYSDIDVKIALSHS